MSAAGSTDTVPQAVAPGRVEWLRNATLRVGILSFGARIVALEAPDREGRAGDVVLGYERPEDYASDEAYLGATIGRYANRIAGGRLSLGGREFVLSRNERGHTLHGGRCGFDRRHWSVERSSAGLALHYVSADGEEGFPGRLELSVRFTLEAAALRIDYEASTEALTVLNLTNHSYFNLSADPARTVLDDWLQIPAHAFTPIDAALIPTGEMRSLEGTPFDFRAWHRIGERIDAPDAQLRLAGGYDHNFVLQAAAGAAPRCAARLYEPRSGRLLEVLTSEPGLQLYSGNQLDGTRRGKQGASLARHRGVCLETQHFPDSPHHPAFPSTELVAGARFASTTIYRFATAAELPLA